LSADFLKISKKLLTMIADYVILLSAKVANKRLGINKSDRRRTPEKIGLAGERMVRRNTRQREYVLEAVMNASTHPTAEEIYDVVREKCANISLTTVYRNLNLLADEGSILRITIPNEPDRFDKTTAAHYHISCDVCKKFEDVDVEYGAEIDREAANKSGYDITGHNIIFHGVCQYCKK